MSLQRRIVALRNAHRATVPADFALLLLIAGVAIGAYAVRVELKRRLAEWLARNAVPTQP